MTTLRRILGFLGFAGGVLWFFFSMLVLMFRGFKAGGPQGGMSGLQWFLCLGAVMFGFIYYAVVSMSQWTRPLLIVGGVIHVAALIAIVSILSFSDGGFIIAPFLLIGPVVWLAYATKSSDSNRSA